MLEGEDSLVSNGRIPPPSQYCFHPCYQLSRAKRLRQKIIRAQAQTSHPIRFLTSFVYNVLQSVALGTHVRDVNCAFKLFRKSFFDVVKLDSDGFLIDAGGVRAGGAGHRRHA